MDIFNTEAIALIIAGAMLTGSLVYAEGDFTPASADEIAGIPDTEQLFSIVGDIFEEMGASAEAAPEYGNYKLLGSMHTVDLKYTTNEEKDLLVGCMYVPFDEIPWSVNWIEDLDSEHYYYLGESFEGAEDLYDYSTGELLVEADVVDMASLFDEEDASFSIKHGELLDANPNGGVNGNTLVIKAKIGPSYSNKATIDQNYFNIEDLVKNQDADRFDAIDYWAVADMTDGSEAKVVSFLVPQDVCSSLKDGKIAANMLGNYVQDLYILPSLLN